MSLFAQDIHLELSLFQYGVDGLESSQDIHIEASLSQTGLL